MITLPLDNGRKTSENQKYSVIYSDDGTITLVPEIEGLFRCGQQAEYYKKDKREDLTPEGRELF